MLRLAINLLFDIAIWLSWLIHVRSPSYSFDSLTLTDCIGLICPTDDSLVFFLFTKGKTEFRSPSYSFDSLTLTACIGLLCPTDDRLGFFLCTKGKAEFRYSLQSVVSVKTVSLFYLYPCCLKETRGTTKQGRVKKKNGFWRFSDFLDILRFLSANTIDCNLIVNVWFVTLFFVSNKTFLSNRW
jgi:hypothetical protein